MVKINEPFLYVTWVSAINMIWGKMPCTNVFAMILIIENPMKKKEDRILVTLVRVERKAIEKD